MRRRRGGEREQAGGGGDVGGETYPMQSAFPCNRAIMQYDTSDLNPTVAAILHLNPPAPHQRRHSLTRLERISLPGASLLLLPGASLTAPGGRGAGAPLPLPYSLCTSARTTRRMMARRSGRRGSGPARAMASWGGRLRRPRPRPLLPPLAPAAAVWRAGPAPAPSFVGARARPASTSAIAAAGRPRQRTGPPPSARGLAAAPLPRVLAALPARAGWPVPLLAVASSARRWSSLPPPLAPSRAAAEEEQGAARRRRCGAAMELAASHGGARPCLNASAAGRGGRSASVGRGRRGAAATVRPDLPARGGALWRGGEQLIVVDGEQLVAAEEAVASLACAGAAASPSSPSPVGMRRHRGGGAERDTGEGDALEVGRVEDRPLRWVRECRR